MKGSPIAIRLEESSILYTWYQSLASISHPGCFPLRPLRLCGETRDSGRLLEETLEIHTLELGWYNLQESELETASLLDLWLYWLLHAHQYDAQTLGSLFSQPEFQKATDSIDRIAKKTEDKAMYDTREKAIRDQQWILNAARREGLEEGELFGKIRMLQNLLSLPQSTDQELQPKSRTELDRLATELQAQLRKRMT